MQNQPFVALFEALSSAYAWSDRGTKPRTDGLRSEI